MKLIDNPPVSPGGVLLGKTDYQLAEVPDDLWPANAFGLPPCTQLLDPSTIRLRCDDADHVRNVVVELLADRQ